MSEWIVRARFSRRYTKANAMVWRTKTGGDSKLKLACDVGLLLNGSAAIVLGPTWARTVVP